MLVDVLVLVVGFILILLLAEIVIRNTLQLAKHYGFSGTFVGLTVLSIGTSIPEIMTHIVGSIKIVNDPSLLNTLSGLLLGNNIGSDIFQQNFVLPLVAIIGTVVVIRKNLFVEMGGLIAAALLVWFFSFGGVISRLEGFLLLVAYLFYLLYLKKNKISERGIVALNHLSRKDITIAIMLIIMGFVFMAFVSGRVLDSATVLISMLPISASFFGVILLGIASALPELTTSLIAIFKGKKDVSAGILIGSNITNPLFGIGIGALISSYTVPSVMVIYDLPVKIVTAFVILYFLLTNEELRKVESVVLIMLFILYVVVRQIYWPVDF